MLDGLRKTWKGLPGFWKGAAAALAVVLAVSWLGGYGSGLPGVETGSQAAGNSAIMAERAAVSPDTQAMKVAGAPAPAFDTAGDGRGSAPQQVASQSAAIPRMVVMNRSLTLQVDDVRERAARLEAMAGKASGYVQNMSFYSDGLGQPMPLAEGTGSSTYKGDAAEPRGGTIVLRVPASRFKAFAKAAAALGRVLDESESADDVTQQNADMTARLKNLKVEESRMRAIFSEATKVSDMLAIESELSRVRGEIESMSTQLDQLHKSVSMATLTVNLQKRLSAVEPSGPDWGFQEALRGAVLNFVSVLNGLIRFAGAALPLALLVLLVWGIWRAKALLAARRSGRR